MEEEEEGVEGGRKESAGGTGPSSLQRIQTSDGRSPEGSPKWEER